MKIKYNQRYNNFLLAFPSGGPLAFAIEGPGGGLHLIEIFRSQGLSKGRRFRGGWWIFEDIRGKRRRYYSNLFWKVISFVVL